MFFLPLVVCYVLVLLFKATKNTEHFDIMHMRSLHSKKASTPLSLTY